MLLRKQWRTGGIRQECRACRNAGERRRRKDPAYREAHNAGVRQLRAKRKGQGLPVGDPRHGTENGATYYRCTCVPCKEARNEAAKLRRLKRKARAAGLSEAEIAAALNTRGKSSISTVISFEDRLIGSTWDDPVAEEVISRCG